jgi:uncharacterized protein YprB with RNaseH-like and TPR domain
MATLILDLKTVGESWDGLPETTQAHLLRWGEYGARSQAERQLWRDDIRDGLGRSPFTGQVVSLGIFDRERQEGVMYVSTGADEAVEPPAHVTTKVRSEAAILTDFWDGVQQYDTIVTWNGRSFAIPFLLHRSVAHGVMPAVDLLRKRYLSQQTPPYHIDLQDELSWYGALSRRPSLAMVCRTYEIPGADGCVGYNEVSRLVVAGRWNEVVRHSTNDLLATVAVYEKWLQYLAPRDFVQNVDF